MIGAVGVVYAYISVEQFIKGNPAMGICFAGYAFANVGLFLLAK
ncbi:hypothetical protein QIH87_49920 (plasmid) [Bradyrhizobium elkanii]|nr:hypothetical protein [Bradyrhizobium elkanii]MCW2228073.1 hypothetical protein [Bradyrhizobium elkanii]WLB14848.1 hypothetical protein QIH87_49920 [Bradyrhizobium elkanii]WLB69060.1 hypothetical protein QIH89_27485 [Bradyrhizobium elkanii]